MTEWKKVKLGYVSQYANDRINVQKINLDNYISTENMLPEKAGITVSSGLPNINSFVPAYKIGDVLVSNIRPYFKKIWFADKNGGCSNDVLVFRVKQDAYEKKFLYYVLSSDNFFNYSMSTSKGTKMPRGDKPALMNYLVPLPSPTEQRAIADTLSCLDNMIELNNQTNKVLEEMAQAIFKRWFIDFEFPDENGNPYKSSGGKMTESELGEIPVGWRVGRFNELIAETISGDWGKDQIQGTFTEKVVCIRGADIPEIVKGNKGNAPYRYILAKNCKNKALSANEIIIEISGGSPTQSTGRCALIFNDLINAYDVPMICTNFCRAIRFKNQFCSHFVYIYWRYLYNQDVFFQYENGTTGIKNLDLMGILSREKIILPADQIMIEFSNILAAFEKNICNNARENNKLATVRDSLLPKLMSGEIRVGVEEG